MVTGRLNSHLERVQSIMDNASEASIGDGGSLQYHVNAARRDQVSAR
jgi:hypothetical protein